MVATPFILAEEAVVKTDHKDPAILDTLAAAHAENGEFPTAIDVERKAIGLSGDENLTKDLQAHLKSFQEHKAWRE